MPFYHDPHDLVIQTQELIGLNKNVRSHLLGGSGWHRRIEFIFINTDYFFLAHIWKLEVLKSILFGQKPPERIAFCLVKEHVMEEELDPVPCQTYLPYRSTDIPAPLRVLVPVRDHR